MNMSINTVAEMDSKQVKQIAIDIGFDIVGVARAEQLREHRDHVNRWLDDGHHASMSWLAKGVDRRCDPSEILVGCRSVVVVGVNYYQGNSGNTPPLIPPYFAGGGMRLIIMFLQVSWGERRYTSWGQWDPAPRALP